MPLPELTKKVREFSAESLASTSIFLATLEWSMKDRAMAIYLVRHGAAKAEAEDPQRSLTDGGKQTVERIGEHLVKCGVTLDRIEQQR